MTLLWLIARWLTIIDNPTVTVWWLTIIDDPTVTDCMVIDHQWWPYPAVTVGSSMMVSHSAVTVASSMMVSGDWPSLMTLLWLIAWWLTIIDDPTVTVIAWWLVIIDLPYCDWLYGDWLSLIYPTVTDCMVTGYNWWPYYNHSHSRVINDNQSPYNHSHSRVNQWYPVTIQTVTVGSSIITSHHTISHSRVNQW
jgi:hypothetical protein